jgi:DNA-binding response OmpR family regulator
MPQHPLRILIVEDDALTAAAFAAALGDQGHAIVAIADNSAAAIAQAWQALAAAQPADLALVDITLTDGRTGLETARALNDNFVIPTMLVSGEAELRVKAAAVRAIGYVAKPADASDVVRAIAALVERRLLPAR